MIVIIMGASGSGKTLVSRALAEHFSTSIIDGDDYHPDANIERMQQGLSLDDACRWPWLDNLADAIRKCAYQADANQRISVIASCSALKRAYRDYLRTAILANAERSEEVVYLHLDVSESVLKQRVAERQGHFFRSEQLVEDQLAILEPLDESEPLSYTLDGVMPVDKIIKTANNILLK